MKDIGILTFHDTSNFGAVLQAYATYKTINHLGYSCEIINYQNENIRKRENPEERHKDSKGLRDRFKWVLRDYKEIRKYDQLISFLKSDTEISRGIFDKSNFQEVSEKYKGILVGSDMLWCTRYTCSDYSYMLEGIQGIKKYSYATSVGHMWEDEEEDRILDLLSDFNCLAVREIDVAEYLTMKLGKDVHNVCDPTMLITQNEWKKMVLNRTKYDRVLIYMDDHEHNCFKAARVLTQKYDINVQTVGFRVWPLKKTGIIELYSIQDFLTAIYNSRMVVTASYHGLLFAIYFHIPFVYYNKDCSRMSTLADRIGIGYRDGNKYNISEMKEIDWEKIDKNIENFRKTSMDVLKGMISEIC